VSDKGNQWTVEVNGPSPPPFAPAQLTLAEAVSVSMLSLTALCDAYTFPVRQRGTCLESEGELSGS
jgi:hypothetical protein